MVVWKSESTRWHKAIRKSRLGDVGHVEKCLVSWKKGESGVALVMMSGWPTPPASPHSYNSCGMLKIKKTAGRGVNRKYEKDGGPNSNTPNLIETEHQRGMCQWQRHECMGMTMTLTVKCGTRGVVAPSEDIGGGRNLWDPLLLQKVGPTREFLPLRAPSNPSRPPL